MEVICNVCNKTFERDNRHVKWAIKQKWKIFCSKACQSENRLIKDCNFNCATCNKDIRRTPGDQTSLSNRYYCSKHCATISNNHDKTRSKHPNWCKGKYLPYRKIAFDAYPKRCNRCSYTECINILVVHHKDKNRSNNTVENLEVLCPNCHAKEHWL